MARRQRRAFRFPPGTFIAEHGHGGTAVNWFNLAALGWVILIAALAIAAYKLGMSPIWIAIGSLALLGIGIISAVSKAKPRI
jgi:Na+-translocating ferredoxin:NAD+ oxidoreductase RnfD subunit